MTTLLILSVGTLVGGNILDACDAFRPGLRVVGVNSLAEAVNNFRCDLVYLAPPAREADAYWRCVESMLEHEDPDLVLAGRDADIPLLSQWRQHHPRWAHRFVVGTEPLSLLMTDKLAGHDWSLARGLPFAPTVAAHDPSALGICRQWMADPGAILIAKPRGGSGSRGIRLLLDDASLVSTLGNGDLVIQPYLADAAPYRALDGQSNLGMPLFWTPALTQFVAHVVIGPDGTILGRFDMQTTMVAGRCEQSLAFDDETFRATGDRFAVALADAGWRGPASVQMLRHEQLGYQAIEFNAPSCAMMSRLLLGFDEMALMLSAWTGKTFQRPPAATSPMALLATRDIGLQADDSRHLGEHGTWPRSC